MRMERVYENISEILGNEQGRFFGEGYKLVNHEIVEFNLDPEEKYGKGKVKIEYSDAFSKKGDAELQAHFTTLDVLMLTRYACQKIIENQYICNSEDWWFKKIKISTTMASTDLEREHIDFTTEINNMEICGEGYEFDFSVKASNLKVECSVHVDGEIRSNCAFDSNSKRIMLQKTYIGDKLLKSKRSIEDTFIESDCNYLISKINIENSCSRYYDIFDMFLSMSQQVQALLYKYDNLSRDQTNNLWMREIEFKCKQRLRIKDYVYQIVNFDKTKLLTMSGGVTWRIGTVNVAILNFPEIKIKAKIAHILPESRGVAVNE